MFIRFIFSSIIVLLFLTLSFSQKQPNNKILTLKDNEIWLDSLKNVIPKEKRYQMIKQKILSDTLYNQRTGRGVCFDLIYDTKHSKRKEKNYYECKTTIVLIVRGKYFLLDMVQNPDTDKIFNLLQLKYIDSISIMDSYKSTVYYANPCGAIEIFSGSKKFLKLISK